MSAVAEVLKKLSIQKGDILLVSDYRVKMQLLNMPPPDGVDFNVPVLFAKESDIRKVDRHDLEEALKLLDANK